MVQDADTEDLSWDLSIIMARDSSEDRSIIMVPLEDTCIMVRSVVRTMARSEDRDIMVDREAHILADRIIK